MSANVMTDQIYLATLRIASSFDSSFDTFNPETHMEFRPPYWYVSSKSAIVCSKLDGSASPRVLRS